MNSSRPVAILGAGGFAREVLDIFEARSEAGETVDVLGFLVDPQFGEPGTMINDKPILGGLDWLESRATSVDLICGVGAPEIRLDLVRRASRYGSRWTTAIHPSVVMTRWVKLGDGVVIGAGTILTNQIRVGDHVHLNLDCTVGHDVVIRDFVTVSPGVHISGKVEVRPGAYLGTGAAIIEKRVIGEWAVVGAGAVVSADVPANSTAVGVPARVIKVREPGWQLVWAD